MERWQIIVIAIVVGVIWMMFKRQRSPGGGAPRDHSLESHVEQWFQKAQDRVAALPEDVHDERAQAWAALSRGEKIGFSERFMSVNFGPQSIGKSSPSTAVKVPAAAPVSRLIQVLIPM